MAININLFGEFLFLWVPLSTMLIFFVARNKTEDLKKVLFLGFFLSFIPLFSIIYIVVWAFKPNIKQKIAMS